MIRLGGFPFFFAEVSTGFAFSHHSPVDIPSSFGNFSPNNSAESGSAKAKNQGNMNVKKKKGLVGMVPLKANNLKCSTLKADFV